ncbi:hypothetical protein SKAU_G00103610 [Synaphobranchus kaupii]|uniref:Uncharacterized protein n=1 Tax=Synaphobranchus kaupii TaxID=118154 RepID=A0A9Q1FZV0_SYNKA|nr:hypothetical protein SKAU_G00103610 [Synaphobranchus kaupii]
MPGLISYLLLVGLALAGAFPTITETEDLTPSVDDFDLVNYESDLFPELVDENTSDFDDFEIADGVYESVEGDVGAGSFKFIPGGVKLLSEGSGLPEHEAEEQRWYDEFGGGLSEAETPAVDEHGRALPGREEDHTERTDRTNDEPASYGDVATPRAGVEEDGRLQKLSGKVLLEPAKRNLWLRHYAPDHTAP